MKLRVIFVVMILMCIGITVEAESDRYLIKLNDSVRLFDCCDEVNQKDYISVDSDELQDYIDAGVVEYFEPDFYTELHCYNLKNYEKLTSMERYKRTGIPPLIKLGNQVIF